ncbi:hypothetical protein BHU72_11380 [Desulfuribacillus stibiiarsenatis]|uniref:Heme chaperone HemW n=1 Tax=Desulfuribacillus stibiiarsenatis TaxID=1390249 RepID=A0A1E5L7L7_9FIRM|nr:radical SAM family heme chaperone HemW [Desulfuribacillus stibiiarsenatis]OEH86135.1 hypothetical protein BHU72_11380 [Desulfuribacillus stibiiarsenatis]
MKINDASLYIHIPYCVQKCQYCDFASYVGKNNTINTYIHAIENEIAEFMQVIDTVSLRTIFIGGGTPTILSAQQLERLFSSIHKHFHLHPLIEFTVEANPGTITDEKLEVMKRYAVNRISMGVQSMQQQELNLLGRIHTVEDVCDTVERLHSYQLDNWNIDLMYGIPGQTLESWKSTLEQAIDLAPQHISTYSLKIEEDTPFYHKYHQGKLPLPDEDEVVAMYQHAIDMLPQYKFMHYEISNFAKGNNQSQHNLQYWRNHNYIGLGVSAASYISNIRYTNPATIDQYIEKYQNKPDSNTWIQLLKNKIDTQSCSKSCQMEDFVMLGLRTMDGISVSDFWERYLVKFDNIFGSAVHKLITENLIERTKSGYKLTNRGILFANDVIEAFFE